ASDAPQARLSEGTVTLADGRRFTGAFDPLTGVPRSGCRLVDDGDRYEGEYNASWQRHGRGSAVLADGTTYEGRFEQDDFVGGAIKQGELRAATFTYEGDFDGTGMAHGTGRAEQLALDRKLVFTGQWVGGNFVKGVVEDEFGNPVDMKAAPDVERQLYTKE